MEQILIPFECDQQVDHNSFILTLNNSLIPYQIENNNIIINIEINAGVNLLTIKLINAKENFVLKIKDFILNKVSARQTLYLAFCQIESKNVNTTWLTNRDNVITIPFGNPISWWLSECSKKIANDLYGTNLYEQFELFYPESIEIDTKFPRLMQDFMKHNLGFHLVSKNEYDRPLHNKKIPYLNVDLDYDENLLFNEFLKNVELLNNNYYKPKQNEYNSQEIEKLELWQVAMAVPTVEAQDSSWKENILYSQEDFPLFYNLLERITAIGGIRIIHAFIGQVKPYSYVAPHVDDFSRRDAKYLNTGGCAQFFIPIGWKSGNYYKFADIGLIPYDQGALLSSTGEFMHGSVNASDSVRFTIGILCEFTDDSIVNLLSHC